MVLTHLLAFAILGPAESVTCVPTASMLPLVGGAALLITGPVTPPARPALRVRAANNALQVRRG
jgi:hypothetical protein